MYPNQMDEFFALGTLIGGFVGLLIWIGIAIAICLLIIGVLKRVPPQHREMEPGMVWLLLIPCFNLIWNFFVFPKTSRSLKAYFDAVGDTSVEDCGGNLGLAYAILSVLSIIPYLGCLTGIAALVVLIIYLVKINDLKNRIPESPSAMGPPSYQQP